MSKFFFYVLFIILFSKFTYATGYDVFGVGYYDIKFDGSQTNSAADLRYERRFDKSIFNVGPENKNFFYIKPFVGFESTTDSAFYFISGIYLEDNVGELFVGKESKFNFTPSFGAGYYSDGDGKKLGNNIEFRTTLEISYELDNKNRLGVSFGHISNANIGDKNPGVEILSFSYQVPFN
jgi:hypothetical protein|tara:strand:+ start:36 stop:572 length:537 start_codon:yes stop_codon:yes gene_type:complete